MNLTEIHYIYIYIKTEFDNRIGKDDYVIIVTTLFYMGDLSKLTKSEATIINDIFIESLSKKDNSFAYKYGFYSPDFNLENKFIKYLPIKSHNPMPRDALPPSEAPPKIIFHVTTKDKVSEIYKKGIIPQNGGHSIAKINYRPNRVYFMFNERDAISFATQLIDYINKTNSEKYVDSWLKSHPNLNVTNFNITDLNKIIIQMGDIVILKVISSGLRKGTKFYKDTEFPEESEAYYTVTHIPPTAIIRN